MLPTCDAVTDGVTSHPQSLVNLFWEAVCTHAHMCMHVCVVLKAMVQTVGRRQDS